MMYCPNCGSQLKAVDTEEMLSQDLIGGDYYTHRCLQCKTYWHLHIHSGNVDLISTGVEQEVASKKITKDLAVELRNRADTLEAIQ